MATITALGKRLAIFPVAPGAGATTVTIVTSRPAKRIAATYGGDALFLPSASRAIRS